MSTVGTSRRLRAVLAAAVGLVLLGGGVAAMTQTSAGAVEIKDTRFVGTDGNMLSGLLYVPSNATAETPAPAVLATHGYINSRETQDAVAIELSRRGYVVLALDQYGHGNSQATAFYAGYGGPAALAYLRTLDIVDKDNIGLEGHSMGGWTAVSAAAAFPEGYKSMVLSGSSVGGGVAPEGTTDFPRNVKIVYGTWEEFSPLMWEVANPGDAQSGDKMKAFFGTSDTIEAGKIYGSIEDGTARQIVRPVSNHPGLTFDAHATQEVVDWFDQTLEGGTEAAGQLWWLKELGTLVAFFGGILAIFAVGGLLMRTPYFGAIAQPVPAPRGSRKGAPWLIAAAISALVPAITFFWFNNFGSSTIRPNALLPQEISNGIIVWALLSGLISLVLLIVWHLTSNKKTGGTIADFGLLVKDKFTWSVVGRAALLASASVASAYLLLVISDWLFKTDFRLYVFQMHIMDATHFAIFLVYLIPFTVFFLMLAAGLHSQLRWTGGKGGVRKEMVANAIVLSVGILLLIIVSYVPLVLGGTLLIPDQPLLIIIAYQFVPILAIAGLLLTFFYHKTGTIYAGAFAAALVVSWNVTAGTATHFMVTEWSGVPFALHVVAPVLLGVVLLVIAFVAKRRMAARSEPAEAGEPASPLESATK